MDNNFQIMATRQSPSLANLGAALCAAQGEMPAVAFDMSNTFFKSKYATLGALIEAARPILLKHGLSVVQMPIAPQPGTVGVETMLLHSSGEFIASSIALTVGDEKGKSTAQVAGSIITYLRRYALAATLWPLRLPFMPMKTRTATTHTNKGRMDTGRRQGTKTGNSGHFRTHSPIRRRLGS